MSFNDEMNTVFLSELTDALPSMEELELTQLHEKYLKRWKSLKTVHEQQRFVEQIMFAFGIIYTIVPQNNSGPLHLAGTLQAVLEGLTNAKNTFEIFDSVEKQ